MFMQEPSILGIVMGMVRSGRGQVERIGRMTHTSQVATVTTVNHSINPPVIP